MNILLYEDIFEKVLSSKNYNNDKKIFDMVYNSSRNICFSKKYIEFIEKSISDRDAFNALIVELSDNGRLLIENTTAQQSIKDEFIHISKFGNTHSALPIILNDNSNFTQEIPFLIDIQKSKPHNKQWIAIELITKNYCSVSYLNFKKDGEINDFFNSIFSIPKKIKEVSIFDREHIETLIPKISGVLIKYYSLQNNKKQYELLETEVELKKKISGKLKLFTTKNPRPIHERKIIIDNMMITMDNSRNNLVVTEPTWEISIDCDYNKINKWKEKCVKFIPVTN